MDDLLYDEFGNYLGSDRELDSDDERENVSLSGTSPAPQNELVVRQEYGPEVEIIVPEHDAQPLSQPLVAPEIDKRIIIEDESLPKTRYARLYLMNVAETLPERVRNLVLVGNLHSGKSTLFDSLVYYTHEDVVLQKKHGRNRSLRQTRFTDTHRLEEERGLSIKASAGTFLIQDLAQKSMVMNVIDSPGHVNFTDEMVASLTACDGVMLVIDAVEGLTEAGKYAIRCCIMEDLAIILVINKLDRLALELKLPVSDLYQKIRYIITQVNTYMKDTLQELDVPYSHPTKLLPLSNNVAFAAGKFRVFFTLRSFAKRYSDIKYRGQANYEQLAQRLWGDNIVYDDKKGTFSRSDSGMVECLFVLIIWKRLYKVFTLCAINLDRHESGDISDVLSHGLTLSNDPIESPEDYYGGLEGFADIAEKSIPAPVNVPENKIISMIDHDDLADMKSSEFARALRECNPESDLLIARVSKLCNTKKTGVFNGLTRVYSGTLKVGQKVKVLGSSYDHANNDDDLVEFEIRELFMPSGRYNFPVSKVPAGSICLIGTSGDVITKCATVTAGGNGPYYRLRPGPTSLYDTSFKVSVKPNLPSHLPALLTSLQSVDKSYFGIEIKAEESGEYVIAGPGELYLDCALFDTRYLFGDDLQIKVSDPFVRFQETVSEKTLAKVVTSSANGKNQVSVICEPLETQLAKDIKSGRLHRYKQLKPRQQAKLFQKYGYDALAARNVWEISFDGAANAFVNDTLSDEVNSEALKASKQAMIQGFLWAVKQGPLCDEPISDVKFRLISAQLAEKPMDRTPGQILPMIRKACYAAFFLATPRLLEPVFHTEITCFRPAVRAASMILLRRRGGLVEDTAIPASPLYIVKGVLPILDSVGFESDLRLQTQGQAMCFSKFAEWGVVSGDPLDEDAFVPKLKPAQPQFLARDLVVKTRYRKGLTGSPTVEKYVDQETYQSLQDKGLVG